MIVSKYTKPANASGQNIRHMEILVDLIRIFSRLPSCMERNERIHPGQMPSEGTAEELVVTYHLFDGDLACT